MEEAQEERATEVPTPRSSADKNVRTNICLWFI
jgi:hypothetical protein